MSSNVKLSDCIAPSFGEVHKLIKNSDEYSRFWFKGGRGSTKSSFVAIELILGIVKDPNANALVLRKVDNTVNISVAQTLLWAIDMLDLNEYFHYTKSPARIIYKPTGQTIVMTGLDDARKLKSIKLSRGYFKYTWYEELEEFSGMEEIRSVRQSTRRGGHKFIEFASYNPPNDPAAWVNAEVGKEDPERLVHTSNYQDVPRHWLGDQFFRDAELLKRHDRLAYDHEYMGLAVGRADQVVFYGKWEEKEFEEPQARECYQGRFFHGADWGFANDPTTGVRCFIQDNCLYVSHEVGGHGVEIDELPQLFDAMPESRKWKLYGDAARPETVSYLKNRGFNCESAPKWQGSVEDGVEYLRGFNKIYIHPRCRGVIEEMSKYSYKVDKHTKEILPIIVDKHNHYIDALRYALADYIKGGVSILDVL